jgi:hypothetical protein
VQVQQEADVQRPPLVAEQVVQRCPIAGELLLAPVAQHHGLAGDDGRRPGLVGYQHTLERRGGRDARDAGAAGQLGQQRRELVAEQLLASPAQVHPGELGHHRAGHRTQRSVEIDERQHRTS